MSRGSEMCNECIDSGRELTDSISQTSSQQSHASNGAGSTCTDSSDALQSDASRQGALKIASTRRALTGDQSLSDSLGGYGGRLLGHVGGWGSAEHLETDVSVQQVQPVRRTSSVNDLLDTTERPVRGILRKRLPDRYMYAPTRPRFVFSRYNPQFRTLPVPRRGQQSCWPPPELPVQKSFLSLQKFRRRSVRREHIKEGRDTRRPVGEDLAALRQNLEDEARSLSYLSATELGDVRYFSRLEINDAQYFSGIEAADKKNLYRPDHVPSDNPSAKQQGRQITSLREYIRRSDTSVAWRDISTPTGGPAATSRQSVSAPSAREGQLLQGLRGPAAREEQLLERLIDELVNTPPTLKRWYQAISEARNLGLILPLYRGLHDRLDPVTLAKLLFKVSHG